MALNSVLLALGLLGAVLLGCTLLHLCLSLLESLLLHQLVSFLDLL